MSLTTFKLVFTLAVLGISAIFALLAGVTMSQMFGAMALVIASGLWAENIFIRALLDDSKRIEKLLKEESNDTTGES